MARISVCIATYNGEKYIRDQIYSIINQLSNDDEIIISDDYSSDNTINIIKSVNDSRIKIYFNENSKGYTSNFENALNKCKGTYIFLSDQDDIWLPNKVIVTLKYLINNEYDMVISDCFIADENLNIITNSYFDLRRSKMGTIHTLIKPNYLGCCMAFNKRILKKALPFPKNHKFLPHDLWLGLLGYSSFHVKTINEKLILYRRHNNNASNGGLNNKNSLIFKFSYRLYALLNILYNKFFRKV